MKIVMAIVDELNNNLLDTYFDKIIITGNFIKVYNKNKIGLYNLISFNKILDCIWDYITIHPQGILVASNSTFGFFSLDGKKVLNCEWDKIKVTPNGLIVYSNNKQGFYNYNGICIFECSYRNIEVYSKAIVAFKNKKRYVYNIFH